MNPGATSAARRAALLSALAPAVVFGLPAVALLVWGREHLHGLQQPVLLAVGAFGLWRYGWQLLNIARAAVYARWHFPRLRADAQRLAALRPLPGRLFVIVASYLEEAWVTMESFQSLMSNIADLPCQVTVVVAAGSDADEALISAIYQSHPARRQVELVFQRQGQGKRRALGHALRAVARRDQDEPDSITVLMDGDSWLQPGALARCLPFFLAWRDLGAVTTNEVAFIPTGGAWYRDWFGLKFGQRHLLFQSHSLSHRVLTLTGRFSIVRTAIVVQEDYISLIENDTVEHWLHGRMRFLMGDDKSSWFYLLRQGWNMLYIPDVSCCSLESREVGFVEASLSLPYRWYGNTLRNVPRALALGPARTGGLFIWLALLDQRLSMWSSLVGIGGAVALAAFKSALYLPLYVAWAVLVRAAQLLVIAWHGHAVTLRTVPLMLYTQWVGAFVKIHAWHHLGDQRWSKGGARQGTQVRRSLAARLAPKATMVLAHLAFAAMVLLTHSLVRWPDVTLLAAQPASTDIDARLHGVVPDDGRDDAEALQQLLDRVAGRGPVTVVLPAGQLDIGRPLVIRHDLVSVRGQGQDRTRLVSQLRSPAAAVVQVQGQRGRAVAALATDLPEDARVLPLDRATDLAAGDLVLLRQPNDDALFRALDSRVWRREQPFLRQAMLRVARVDGARVEVEQPAGIRFAAGVTQVVQVRPVRGVHLADFGIEQRVPGHAIAEVRMRFDNLFPVFAVDGIALDWTADATVERVAVRNAGRHPVSFDNSYGFALRDCRLEGAWNKGDGGNGYLRIARSYRGVVEGCTVRDIRHITLQWSAAHNRLAGIDTDVDLNFHGGYTHHNVADGMRFTVPPGRPWKAVSTTPPDAGWAPPDGPGNRVVTAPPTASTAPAARAASPAH